MQKGLRDSTCFKKGYQKKLFNHPMPPCSQFSLIRDNYFYGFIKGCVRYIFASLCLKSKRKHLSN